MCEPNATIEFPKPREPELDVCGDCEPSDELVAALAALLLGCDETEGGEQSDVA